MFCNIDLFFVWIKVDLSPTKDQPEIAFIPWGVHVAPNEELTAG